MREHQRIASQDPCSIPGCRIGGSGWHTVKDDYDEVVASRWPISRRRPALVDSSRCWSTCPPRIPPTFSWTSPTCNAAPRTPHANNSAMRGPSSYSMQKSPGGTVTLPVNTPFIIAGDMNAVGWEQQINTLLNGTIVNTATYGTGGALDWDNTGLSDRLCPHTDTRMAYTWRSNTSAYPSGRLDYMIHSYAVMTADRSFSVRTEEMNAARLAQTGLLANDNTTASDHLPITTDFAVPLTGVNVRVKAFPGGPLTAPPV